MPEWITAVLDFASWPARWFATTYGLRLTDWEYLTLAVLVYVIEVSVVANFWNKSWQSLGKFARHVGRWSTRTGTLESMRLVEKNTAVIQSACEWIRRPLIPRFPVEARRLSGEKVPVLLAGNGVRVAQYMTRSFLNLCIGIVRLVMACAYFTISRWGFAALLLGVATVYPSAISGALNAAVASLRDFDWSNQFITNAIVTAGAVVTVGVVLVKGLLSDKTSARRHVQEARNREALESLVSLAGPLSRLSYYGSKELESISGRLGWQLRLAEKWIDKKVTRRDIGIIDEDHLQCDENCTDRLRLGKKPVPREFPAKLAEVLDEIEHACEEGNPFHVWRREIMRLSSRYEKEVLFDVVYGDSFAERVKYDLFFLEEDGFKRVRIAWQHHRVPRVYEEGSVTDRLSQLEELASKYRDLMWDTLERLRVYEEISSYAWRINRPRASGLAKASK